MLKKLNENKWIDKTSQLGLFVLAILSFYLAWKYWKYKPMFTDPIIPREYFEPVLDPIMEKVSVLLFGIIVGLALKFFSQNTFVIVTSILCIVYSFTII